MPIFRGEVGVHVVVGAEVGANRRKQLLLHGLRLAEAAAGERRLIKEDFPADDFVDPLLIDVQLTQHIGQCIRIAAGNEINR